MKRIEVDLFDIESIRGAIEKLDELNKSLDAKMNRICSELASIGARVASITFLTSYYPGGHTTDVSVFPTNGGYKIVARGEDVAFIEFGAGAMYGYGYPSDASLEPPMDIGPGTWSDSDFGKGHWDDPNGWYFTKNGERVHSYGNPPAMGMYNAGKSMRQELERIARKVFAEND